MLSLKWYPNPKSIPNSSSDSEVAKLMQLVATQLLHDQGSSNTRYLKLRTSHIKLGFEISNPLNCQLLLLTYPKLWTTSKYSYITIVPTSVSTMPVHFWTVQAFDHFTVSSIMHHRLFSQKQNREVFFFFSLSIFFKSCVKTWSLLGCYDRIIDRTTVFSH